MFRYVRPTSVPEACQLLAEHGRAAKALLGGTDLFVGLRKGKLTAELVVDLKGAAELTPAIEEANAHVTISAPTVMTDIVENERCVREFPALVEAATHVGSIQIRNRATLAGNICNASPAADTALPLLAYGATVVVAGPGGGRRLPLVEFFMGPGQTVLEDGEIVTALELPAPPSGAGSAFGRMTRRRGVDLATINVCCSISPDGSTRFAVGAAGPRPFVVSDESGVLGLAGPDEPEAAATIGELMATATPISDIRGSEAYRRAMLVVLGVRTYGRALERRRRAGQ